VSEGYYPEQSDRAWARTSSQLAGTSAIAYRSIIDRCGAELRRIDAGSIAPPGGLGTRGFYQLVQDIGRLSADEFSALLREAVSTHSERTA
jgi:hypothetical protein